MGLFLTAPDKKIMFESMLTYPLKTNEVVDSIADEYYKVLSSQDAFRRYFFNNPDFEADFTNYATQAGIRQFFSSEAFRAMLAEPASVMIVDLPAMQQSERPEPYFYLLNFEKVIDIGFTSKNEIEYIAFIDGDYCVFFDDTQMVVYNKENNDYKLINQIEHSLGYCPARQLWSDTISGNNLINKQSPITGIIGRLDWLLFFETAKQNLDLFGAYPLYWTLATKCNYTDTMGNRCEGGVITYYDDEAQKEKFRKCPKCESNSIVGPGSLIEKPIPKGENKIESGAPAGIITIDRSSLEYNVNETERLKAEIIQSATGKLKLISKEAVNEEQVQSQFENQTNVLNWIARNMEQAEKWLVETICRYRYGDNFNGCEINWGSRFYLQSVNDAIVSFDTSKKAGLPSYMIVDKLLAIEETCTRGNNSAQQRLRILRNLEPYPEMSIIECKNAGIDTIDKQGFVLKINFATFVSKFEREYGSIIEFGSALSFSEKIDRILTKLNEYVGTKLPAATSPTGAAIE